VVRVYPQLAVALGLFTALGCDASLGEDNKNEPDGSGASGSTLSEEQDPFRIGCDIQAVMAKPENNCTEGGCHGAHPAAGLDLLSPGVEERLVGVAATGEDCGGSPLVDPADPGNSLFLQKIDSERFSLGLACGGIMPIGSEGVSGEDLECFEKWVVAMGEATAPGAAVSYKDEWEDVSVESYLSKVKTLTNGGVVTAAELEQVKADPTALHALIEQWVETPGFEAKVYNFMQVALQQRLSNFSRLQQLTDQADTLSINGGFRNLLHENAMESFARTAQRIVVEGRPFTEIVTTRRWEMTTALVILLAYTELSDDEKDDLEHYIYKSPAPDGAPSTPPTLAESIETGFWYNANRADGCEPTRRSGDGLYDYIFGRFSCAKGDENPIAIDYDFADWRTVELVPAANDAERERFWDFLTLRETNELHVRIPRVGFFTTPAFFGNWVTNEDNQFRVTASQTMIASLGREFTPGDLTTPLTDSGLDTEHSEPGTACYSCHTLLDPMRNYFTQWFDVTYQRSNTPSDIEAGFAFRGDASVGGDLYAFADKIAQHPQFASAWTQKLCYYANSQACDEKDPEFIRIATAFEASGFDLKALYADLFSSPLVTGAEYSESYDSRRWLISITRQNHLCRLLDEHLEENDVCSEGSTFIGLIPDDDFARGKAVPVQTSLSSSFHFAAVDALCERLAARLVSGGNTFDANDQEGALAKMLDGLLGLPEGHSRRAEWATELSEHFQAARDAGANNTTAMRSTFTLACTSPEVMAMGL